MYVPGPTLPGEHVCGSHLYAYLQEGGGSGGSKLTVGDVRGILADRRSREAGFSSTFMEGKSGDTTVEQAATLMQVSM